MRCECVGASHDDVLAAALFKSSLLSFMAEQTNSCWFCTLGVLSNRCFEGWEIVQTFIFLINFNYDMVDC